MRAKHRSQRQEALAVAVMETAWHQMQPASPPALHANATHTNNNQIMVVVATTPCQQRPHKKLPYAMPCCAQDDVVHFRLSEQHADGGI